MILLTLTIKNYLNYRKISVPTPQEIKIGHKNGVPVLGTVLFRSDDYFLPWLKDFITKDGSGKLLAIDKLEHLAKTFNFDGWFFFIQTIGLNRSEVLEFVEIIRELKSRGLYVA